MPKGRKAGQSFRYQTGRFPAGCAPWPWHPVCRASWQVRQAEEGGRERSRALVAMHEPRRRDDRTIDDDDEEILARVKDGAAEVADYIRTGAWTATREARRKAAEVTHVVVDTVRDE